MNNEVYKKQIMPHLIEIKKICAQEKIPFFAGFAVTDNNGKFNYETECLTPGVLEIKLSDDRITKMINVINGFDTIPPREMMEIDCY